MQTARAENLRGIEGFGLLAVAGEITLALRLNAKLVVGGQEILR